MHNLNYCFCINLQLINDVLMYQNSTRESGPLMYFRKRIMRYNVPTTVKNNPDAYQEFFVSVGRAYLVEAFLEYFSMENTESEPTKNLVSRIGGSIYRLHMFTFPLFFCLLNRLNFISILSSVGLC